MLGDTEQKGLLGVPGLPKKGMAFLVSDKRKQGYGVLVIADEKKAERLQVSPLSLSIAGTHVLCHVYAFPGLLLPSRGDIQKRGRGRLVSVSKKKATKYKSMDLYRGV